MEKKSYFMSLKDIALSAPLTLSSLIYLSYIEAPFSSGTLRELKLG